MLKETISRSLKEDIGSGDITTESIIPPKSISKAVILAKENGILAGLEVARQVFQTYDRNVLFAKMLKDGDKVKKGQVIAEMRGKTRSILTCERVALNYLQRMSGIATLTNKFVEKVKPYQAQILDTRKTTPTLREFEKYAVRCGGGVNHRKGLYDMVLIKDNHIQAAGSILKAIELARKAKAKIEVEVQNLKQLKEILDQKVDYVMLDNFSIHDIKQAVKMINGRFVIEVSGGITLKTVRKYAAAGADRISVGALTHSYKSLDISLEVI